MPLSGDASTMVGISYELAWTVRCLVRVMEGEAISIRLQPPGQDGEGIEFYVKTHLGIEYHQAKNQITGKGKWSLGELASRGVLTHFDEKLRTQDTTCVFISGHAADTLKELAERARSAESWNEFKQEFISSSTWSDFFSQLKGYWTESGEEDLYAKLKRVQVHVIDEDLLRNLVQSRLESLIDGNPSTAVAVLKEFASSRTHQTLTCTDIWDYLMAHGLNRRDWVADAPFADLIEEKTQAYKSGTGRIGIGREVVPRIEVHKIISAFDGDDDAGQRCILLTGKAGVGKSSVISQALDELDGREWPILALRVDELDPVSTPRDIGKQLGLSASPVSALIGVSGGNPCLLVVDQLDAVSLASGRNPEFFDCISAMLTEASYHPNVNVLVACRRFDVENDHRIRDLCRSDGMAREVTIEEFDEATVKSVVSNLGLNSDNLTTRQIALLSLPIHLRLLADAVKDTASDALGFQTAKDLYDAFWSFKKRILRAHMSSATAQKVVDLSAEKMAERQYLSVPHALLDDFSETLDVLSSENILIADGAKVSFFHEGFFDYIFSRRFVASDLDLVSYILDSDQSLFMRSQLRQVLLHLRDYSPDQAAHSAKALLNHPDIRVHLKLIVLSLLGSVDDPTEDEWYVIESLSKTELAPHVWRVIRGSTSWFDLLDEIGQMQRWLESDDEQVNLAIWLIDSVKEQRSERVAELLTQYLGLSAKWDQRIVRVLSYPDVTTSRVFFDFALSAIAAGLFDDLLNGSVRGYAPWHLVRRAQEAQPKWACELVASCCERLLEIAQQSGGTNPFLAHAYDFDKTLLTRIAESVPASFLKQLMPFLLKVLELYVHRKGDPLWSDSIWSFLVYGTDYSFDNAFLTAMEDAICALAVQSPNEFFDYANMLKDTEFATAHRLLICGYAAGGENYADEAVEYLLVGPDGKFNFGYSDSAHWLTIRLLKSVTPHCSSENLRKLEALILHYYPPHELEASFQDLRGHAQFELLSGFDEGDLSEGARRTYQELSRKFSRSSVEAPKGIVSYNVGSPIPIESARKMSDQNWLRAMRRYSIEWRSASVDPTKGGAVQLSRLLETLTREDPTRFADLANQIPDDTNSIYLGAILQGIVDSDLDLNSVLDLCRRCHRLPGRPLGRWITRPLEHYPDSALPDDILNMIVWYAHDDSNPDLVRDPSTRTVYVGGQKQFKYEAVNVGINSVRGIAAGSIAKLIFQNQSYFNFFKPHLRNMVVDPSDAVRACVAEALLGALRHDRDLAAELFTKLCEVDEDRFLITHFVEFFLRYAGQTHFQEIEPVLQRMINSQYEDVATGGARWTCYLSLSVDEAIPLAQQCLAGSVSMRIGAAEIYSTNLRHSVYKAECEGMLIMMFSDPDRQVRSMAARCFLDLQRSELRDHGSLLEAYVQSQAFELGFNPGIIALEESTADMPRETLLACERFFEIAGSDAGDPSLRESAHSSDVMKLVIRTYSRTTDVGVRTRCLDLIDKANLLGTLGLNSIDETFDR